jgi:hypothetical protein
MERLLVLCPSVWDKEQLSKPEVTSPAEIVFFGEELMTAPSLWSGLTFDAFRFIDRVVDRFGGDIGGVIGTGDYPACIFAAAVGERLGMRVPRPEHVVLFSHKYYSRVMQQRIVPEATPCFAAINPFRDLDSFDSLEVPFFVKPVKGTMSIRAQSIRARDELERALRLTWRERLSAYLLLRPFQQFLERYSDRTVPWHYFIGEGMLRGEQVTVDGFVQNGRATIMGVVDSVMYPGTMSFRRFDYPSRLPVEVQDRMKQIACRVMEGSGFDHACFNIEMFHDAMNDSVQIIEVNPRMSYQFADLYERIDGLNTYAVQIALAKGEPVIWKPGAGPDRAAASFVMRRFEDAFVARVPSEREIRDVAERFPGTSVKVLCKVGERLSAQDQDVGSFRYAIINMSAPTREELFARYDEVERSLPFAFR